MWDTQSNTPHLGEAPPRRAHRHRPGGRHLFPHPGHAYPLTNAGAVLNIDCVSNTDDVIKEWVKALLIYTGVTRTDGEELKVFIPLTLSGKVADTWDMHLHLQGY